MTSLVSVFSLDQLAYGSGGEHLIFGKEPNTVEHPRYYPPGVATNHGD